MKAKYLFAAIAVALAIVPAPARTLKVMTYNVHNGVGLDRQRNHSRIAGIIAAQKPDVVGIQEVDSATVRAANRYVLGELGLLTSMTPLYAPAIDFDGGKYGIGILTARQPVTVRRIPLPGREEPRMMIVADYGDYALINTHLSLTAADAEASVKIIEDVLGKLGDKPVILTGDLNSLPQSPAINRLLEHFRIVSPEATPTFPANGPTEQIDYIMVSSNTPCSVTRADVLPDTVASDHRPLLVTLTIPD